jgi:SpoIIAA-like
MPPTVTECEINQTQATPERVGINRKAMIERLTDMPPGTTGFRVTGEIERKDYDEVLVPELQQALDAGTGLRTLYVIDDLDEIDPGALWADAKVGFNLGIRHRESWVRSAIVTDIEWIVRSTKLFAWMIPGEARVFPRAELEQAKAWVAGG